VSKHSTLSAGYALASDEGPSAGQWVRHRTQSRITALYQTLTRPVDLASLAVFRMLLGTIFTVSAVRFMLSGWVEIVFLQPTFFFKYPGFEWTRVWPASGMYLHYSAVAALGACVALGLFYRVSIVLFVLGFAYLQLLDLTNYLNHYYLVVLLCMLMSTMPLHGLW